ncbi:MAG: class I SAM-dependent methyltransferase [Cyclobacteriaceae bacterium]
MRKTIGEMDNLSRVWVQTKEMQKRAVDILNETIKKFSIQSLLDIPCGDFYWMKDVALDGVRYTGADIVNELIASNKRQFSKVGIEFQKINILKHVLPKVDLIFCRDCLVHLSYKDIDEAIQSVKLSGSTYFMATTFPAHSNYDIITEDWRPINLESAPFSFPKPLHLFIELFEEDERFKDKSLAIWKVNDLVGMTKKK